VSTFVFSITALSVTAILGKAIQIERSARSAEKVEENATFVLESMAKEINVSTITSANSPGCTATTITMIHPVNGTISYSLSGGNVQRTAGSAQIINSGDVTFTNLKFCITGNGGGSSGDNQSTKITILASIQSNIGRPFIANLQTTVVSRDITVELTN